MLEYRELLKLNQLTSKFQYDTVAAQVVGESPSNFQNTVEINVGSQPGRRGGHAGHRRRRPHRHASPRCSRTRSIVLLITDPEFAISAQVLTTPATMPAPAPRRHESTTLSGIPVSDLTAAPPRPTTTTTTTRCRPSRAVTDPGIGDHHGADHVDRRRRHHHHDASLEVVRETGTLRGRAPTSRCCCASSTPRRRSPA